MNIHNIAIGKKIFAALIIFILPVAMLSVFLFLEKKADIDFARQEILGVNYARAGIGALEATTAFNQTKELYVKAIDALKQAEDVDAGKLKMTEQTEKLISNLKPGAEGKDLNSMDDTIATFITDVSDNSYLTLDPDGDTYYVSDLLLNQMPNLLAQADHLGDASKELQTEVTDEHKTAFAIAASNFSALQASITKDITKAVQYNTEGSVKKELESDANEIAEIVGKGSAAAKAGDLKTVQTLVQEVQAKALEFSKQAADEQDHLLNKRIAGFQKQLYTEIGISLAAIMIGFVIFLAIIRSITRPLAVIINRMGKLTQGDLNIELPSQVRGDEIGDLTESLKAFHASALEREHAQKLEIERSEKEKERAWLIQKTTANFESKVQNVVSTVASAATELSHTAEELVSTMNQTSQTVLTATNGASQTTSNVQSVAAAAEELTASVREIYNQLQNSNRLVQDSVKKAESADTQATSLSNATNKVKEVVALISNIAGQINLLALNATIESARAGAAGKGFAVVASEVKNLAGQTDKSVQEIESVISEMNQASEGIIYSLRDIKGSIQNIASSSSTIAASVEQQSHATNEIARSMQMAAEGTQVVSAGLGTVTNSANHAQYSSSQVLDASKELSRQAEDLSREVGEFLQTVRQA